MKTIFFLTASILLSSISYAQRGPCETGPGNNCASGATYECQAVVYEDIKVLLVEHTQVDEIDYDRPIDPSLIISEKILNKEGLSSDPRDYSYSAHHSDGITKVLFTRKIPNKMPKFRFSTDLSKARQNTNPGYEWEFYPAMYDAEGKELSFGTMDFIEKVERTGPRAMMFNLSNLITYDSRVQTFGLQSVLTAVYFPVHYQAVGKISFKKDQSYLGSQVSVATGTHNALDIDDSSLGVVKDDSTTIECNKI